MADTHTFIAGTDESFDTAANWDPAQVPADGDSLLFNHLAQRNLTLNLDQSAKTFARVVRAPGFAYSVGADGGPLKCTITELMAAGRSRVFYHQGAITRALVDLEGTSETACVLEGAITLLAIRQGTVTIAGSDEQPAGARWQLASTSGEQVHDQAAKLVIGSSVDLTTNATTIVQAGGTLDTEADLDELIRSGGTCLLEASAGIALLDQLGGRLYWNSDGTITQAYVGGGDFNSAQYDLAKTLTNMTVYGDGLVDLSRAFNLTLSNAIRHFGRQPIKTPPGMAVSWS